MTINKNSFDFIVIGTGAGLIVAEAALEAGKTVAIIEQDRFGGTCLNYGCIPSKMFAYPADIIRQARHAKAVGVDFASPSIDFQNIVGRIKHLRSQSKNMPDSYAKVPGCSVFLGKAKIVSARQVIVLTKEREQLLHGQNIVIATGAKPSIPSFVGNHLGIDYHGFFNNLPEIPYKNLVILGSGIIACEFAHFFSAFGTNVSIVGRSGTILKNEDGDIQKAIIQSMHKAGVSLLLTHQIDYIQQNKNRKTVCLTNKQTGETIKLDCEEVLIATGVESTALDLLDPTVGVELDKNSFIVTDEKMTTSVPNIYAIGDINGHHLFRHTANQEATALAKRLFAQEEFIINYQSVPHAIFTTDQIAAVGQTEEQLKKSGIRYKRGFLSYKDIAYGWAMGYGQDDEGGFVKVLTNCDRKILGAHAIGYQAAALIQPFAYLMNAGEGTVAPIQSSQPIHPSITELAAWATDALKIQEE